MRSSTAALLALIAAAPIAAALPAARAGSQHSEESGRPPIRAAFYDSHRAGDLPRQIEAMRYGGISAGIASWTGPGSLSDRRVGTLLRAAHGRSFRWALELVEPPRASAARMARELSYIGARYGRDPAYLRVGGRFVVFVADPGRRCQASARVIGANRAGAYLMMESFPGYRGCARQPAGWYDDPSAASLVAHLPASVTISPGPLPSGAPAAWLERHFATWGRDVQKLTDLRPRFELIASFNERSEGNAIESAPEWASDSGHGAYLDLLHSNGAAAPAPLLGSGGLPVAPPTPPLEAPAPAPTVQSLPVPPPASPSPPPPAVSLPPAPAVSASPPPVPVTAPIPPPVTSAPPPLPPAAPDPVVAAAGDIACDPADRNFAASLGNAVACHMKATSDLILGTPNLFAVLALGDLQYERGTYPAFLGSFDKTWGRFKALIRPAVGNHEYLTASQAGYYQYFGAAAGTPLQGWYSFDVGAWHLIALNSNCPGKGQCKLGSAQEQWLRADLAAHQNLCTLAFWHHPRFSSGQHRNAPITDGLWQDLYAAGAELVLTGHDHDYERFAPQTPTGAADPVGGIREFVVGTGGKNHYKVGKLQPNSEVSNADTFGVLTLTLHPTGYDWQFLPEPGKTFTDSGSGTCHGPNGPLP